MPKNNNKKTAKTATKNTAKKTTNTNEVKEETKPKRTLCKECIGFVYGGDYVKISCVYVFKLDSLNFQEYVEKELVPFFGANISGRYVKCHNSNEAYDTFIQLLKDKEYKVDDSCSFVKVSVSNASPLLREVAGTKRVYTIKVNTSDNDVAEDNEEDNNKEDNNDDNDDNDDNEDDEASDVEEEPKKVVSTKNKKIVKKVAKKTTKKGKK
jgi:hypothetical protein